MMRKALIGQAVNCYGALKQLELKAERLSAEQQSYVNELTEEEMAEYLRLTERIDERVEATR